MSRTFTRPPIRALNSLADQVADRPAATIAKLRDHAVIGVLRYANAFLMQTTSTALANGRSKIEERLARWLLLADDRIDGDQLPLTHEFLGLMLGTHRPGVTNALNALKDDGLIATRRAGITILNRKAMEKKSNGTYVPPDG